MEQVATRLQSMSFKDNVTTNAHRENNGMVSPHCQDADNEEAISVQDMGYWMSLMEIEDDRSQGQASSQFGNELDSNEGLPTQTTTKTTTATTATITATTTAMAPSFTKVQIDSFNSGRADFPEDLPSNVQFQYGVIEISCGTKQCNEIVTKWWKGLKSKKFFSANSFKDALKRNSLSICGACFGKQKCPKILQSMSKFNGVVGPNNQKFYLLENTNNADG